MKIKFINLLSPEFLTPQSGFVVENSTNGSTYFLQKDLVNYAEFAKPLDFSFGYYFSVHNVEAGNYSFLLRSDIAITATTPENFASLQLLLPAGLSRVYLPAVLNLNSISVLTSCIGAKLVGFDSITPATLGSAKDVTNFSEMRITTQSGKAASYSPRGVTLPVGFSQVEILTQFAQEDFIYWHLATPGAQIHKTYVTYDCAGNVFFGENIAAEKPMLNITHSTSAHLNCKIYQAPTNTLANPAVTMFIA